MICIKEWAYNKDFVLARLCQGLIDRKLLGIELQNNPISANKMDQIKDRAVKTFNISKKEAEYLVFKDTTVNSAYDPEEPKINILFKNGEVMDIAEASDQLNISVLSKPVKKCYLCYPKEIK